MPDIWVTSDTHFGHANIIKYCDRPFDDVSHMNEVLVENWNATIKPQDKVYHLGDVFMGGEKGSSVLHRLNGKKRLIMGNHDTNWKVLSDTFQKIAVWRMLTEFGLLLTHVPVHASTMDRSKLDRTGQPDMLLNVHGHTHKNGEPDGDTKNYKCVCVELTDFKPVNIEDLRIT